jgi:hypothetical protein
MAYVTSEARQQILDALAAATDDIGAALSALGDAYEQLDEASADELETALFGPVQAAYGRAQRTHAGFADRSDLPRRTFSAPGPGAPSRGAQAFIDAAVVAVQRADLTLGELQDTMLPVEVGDAELREGLSAVRRALGDVSTAARSLGRHLGR